MQKKCRDCDVEMVEGFIPDAGRSAILQALWHPGAPVSKDWLEGILNLPGFTYDTQKMLPIVALRCPQCGELTLIAKKS